MDFLWRRLEGKTAHSECKTLQRQVPQPGPSAKPLRVSSLLRLEFLTLAQNAVSLLWVWIRPQDGTAVRSVPRLRVSANAKWIASHTGLQRRVLGPRQCVHEQWITPLRKGPRLSVLKARERRHRVFRLEDALVAMRGASRADYFSGNGPNWGASTSRMAHASSMVRTT